LLLFPITTFWNIVNGWIVAVITPGGGKAVTVVVIGEELFVNAVSVSTMSPATNAVGAKLLLPLATVITGVKPRADDGPVIVIVEVPPVDAPQPATVIFAATLLATVLLLVLPVEVPLMICTPFTLMPETDVLLLPPLTVMVAIVAVDVVVTTGVKPLAEAGPVIVTVLPEALAVKPASVILAARLLARVLDDVVAAVAPLVMIVPFTETLVTAVLLDPEKVIVADWGPTLVTDIVRPAAEAGPVTVTTLPEDVAL
jgi:hypothetical protein